MSELTLSQDSVERALDGLFRAGILSGELVERWTKVSAFFAAEPAAYSVNVDRAIWFPIIADTGEAIARSMER